MSQGTKDAIWQYLQTLNVLGMTITSIPAEALSTIENVAAQCAGGMGGEGEGEGSGSNDQLMNSMTALLGNLGGMLK